MTEDHAHHAGWHGLADSPRRRRHAVAFVALAALASAVPAAAQTDPFLGVSPPPVSRPASPTPRPEPRPQRPQPPRQAAPQPDIPIEGRVHRERLRLGPASVPLPPGEWVEIGAASWVDQGPPVFGGGGGRGGRGGGVQMHAHNEIVLVRQREGRITAIVVAVASSSDAGGGAQWHPSEVCSGAEAIDRRVASAEAASQDCTRLLRIGVGQGIGSSAARSAIQALAGRRAGFVAPSMPGVQYRFANSLRALSVEYRFAPEAEAALRGWMPAQHPSLRAGFQGRAAALPDP